MALDLNIPFTVLDATVRDRRDSITEQRANRQLLVDDIIMDLVALGRQEGYSQMQTRTAIENLFRTYVSAWFLYVFIGADDLLTDIQNDATLAWLNIDVAGQTVRTRLINRLS